MQVYPQYLKTGEEQWPLPAGRGAGVSLTPEKPEEDAALQKSKNLRADGLAGPQNGHQNQGQPEAQRKSCGALCHSEEDEECRRSQQDIKHIQACETDPFPNDKEHYVREPVMIDKGCVRVSVGIEVRVQNFPRTR